MARPAGSMSSFVPSIMSKKVSLADAIIAYEEMYLASRNFAQRTRKEYLTDLQQLVQYLEGASVRSIEQVQRRHLEGFLAQLDRLALAGTTRRRKLAAVRSLFQFLQKQGLRTGNPAADVVPPDLDRGQP